MSFVDLNAPSAGELLGAQPTLRDGSKGERNEQGAKKGRKRRSANDVTPIEQPPKTRYEMRRNYLNLDRETWRTHWLDVKNLFRPYSTRWLDDGGIPNRGNKKMQYIVDNVPMLALRTMSSGLMAGVTSPSRPWFRLRPADDDLYHQEGVAEWCEKATDAQHRVLQKSNFYRSMAQFYEEIGGIGTAPIGIYEVPFDPRRKHQPLINCISYTAGEYWIAQNDEGVVDTFVRKYKWTVRQVITKFVDHPENPNDPTWNNISPATRALWRARKWDTWMDVIHVIEPNDEYEAGALGMKGFLSRSVYYELGGDPNTLLKVTGFQNSPIKCGRWETNSDDVYGHSPAMLCLGDAKQLMVQQKRKLQAIDKQIEPPLIGDANLKRSTVSLLPGDITWMETTGATTFGLKPIYEVKPELQAMLLDIEATQKRIKAGMYEDVFQMMRSLDDKLKAGITATEINARKQEQLLELGPLLERLTAEVLQPIIEDVFALMVKRSAMAWQHVQRGEPVPKGMEQYVPPPPQALQGQTLRIEYVSILAQAVRIAEVQGIDQVTDYVLKLAEAKPEAMDKFDFDKSIEILSDRLGVPPECIVPDEQVQQIRQARQQAQAQASQQQMQNERAQAMSKSAKDLSQTPVGGSNALEQLLSGPTQGNA